MFSLDIKVEKEWVCLFLFHHEFYIKKSIIFIFVVLEWSINFFENLECVTSQVVFLLYLSLGSVSGFIKGKWRVSFLGFLILWVRS